MKIVDYNVVTYCRSCNHRMVAKRGQQKNYCDACSKKFMAARAKEAEKSSQDE